jgi:hypothetical protein
MNTYLVQTFFIQPCVQNVYLPNLGNYTAQYNDHAIIIGLSLVFLGL